MAKAHILIVEDERIIAEDIKGRLIPFGYSIAGIVAHGERVLATVEQTRPDLVLLDITLRGEMDGIQVAEQLRGACGVPIIFLTAHSDEATLQRATATSPHGYILKPFQERELYSAIETALYRAGTEKKLKESERWLSTILGSIDEAVLAADALGSIRFFNPAAGRMTGWETDQALGRELDDVCQLTDEESGERVEYNLIEVMEGEGRARYRKGRLGLSDGTEATVEYTFSPIADEDRRVLGTVLILRAPRAAREAPAR